MGSKGIVASTAGMAVLLQQGIGDTIRASLTPEPGGDRTQEVIVAQEILQTMGLRAFTPLVIACPGCGRTTSTFFQELAQRIQSSHLRTRMPQWRREYAGVEEMTVAVMGCVVNGPGESKHANIGISLPGTGERPVAPVYEDGEKTVTLKGERIAEEFQDIVEQYVARHYAARRWRQPVSELAQRSCKPCEGGTPPLTRAQAAQLLPQIDECLGAQRGAPTPCGANFASGLLPHHELRERARPSRQHRGPPPGSGSRLQLLPRQLHHACGAGAFGERLRVCGEGGPDSACLVRARHARQLPLKPERALDEEAPQFLAAIHRPEARLRHTCQGTCAMGE